MILAAPPKDWKRPAISNAVKLRVLLNQDGRCKETGVKLAKGDIHFDHRPELWERQFDTEAWDTIPPANDHAHIEAITIKSHDIRTNGPGGEKRITTAGSGANRRAKIKRLTGVTGNGRKKAIPSHANAWPPKGSRKLQSRGFEKRP